MPYHDPDGPLRPHSEASLTGRLISNFRRHPGRWVSGADIERRCIELGYKASNASRRLRELADEGVLLRGLYAVRTKRGRYTKTVHYCWNSDTPIPGLSAGDEIVAGVRDESPNLTPPPDAAIDRFGTPNRGPSASEDLSTAPQNHLGNDDLLDQEAQRLAKEFGGYMLD